MENKPKRKIWHKIAIIASVVCMMASVTLTSASAYIAGTGDDIQAGTSPLYYPFSVYTSVDPGLSNRISEYSFNSVYDLAEFGNAPTAGPVTITNGCVEYEYTLHDNTTDTYRMFVRASQAWQTDNATETIYLTVRDIGYLFGGENIGTLDVYVPSTFQGTTFLQIKYYVLQQDGTLKMREWSQSNNKNWELRSLMRDLCGQNIAIYIDWLSYQIIPNEQVDMSELSYILRTQFKVCRSQESPIPHESEVGFYDGAWWGHLISETTNVANVDMSSWLVTAFGGFFGTEFFGFLSIGDILLFVIGVALVVIFIRMFAGG